MDEHARYLSRLTFDPSLKNSLPWKYLNNFRLMIMLALGIVIIGLVKYSSIPRRLNPEIQIPIVTVSTVLPGASPIDIEQKITVPLEDKIKSVKNIDTITSSSRDNVSVIVIQFLSTVQSQTAVNDVQQAVNTTSGLPDDAQTPLVSVVDFENQPVWTFALYSNDLPSLMQSSEELKKALEDVSTIDHVSLTGKDTQQIIVRMDPAKALQYNISPLQFPQIVKSASISYPAGTVRSGQNSFSFSIDQSLTSIEDIRQLQIPLQDGESVSLGEIAEVSGQAQREQPLAWYTDNHTSPQRAIEFFVFKTKTSNIDASAKAAETTVHDFLAEKNDKLQLVSIENTGTLIEDQFSDLVKEFRSTIILIFLILLFFLGIRQAVIASFTVPLTFLSAIAIASMLGLTLNFLTLFAFLLALGLLIDDTIVVVTAMTRYYASGSFTAAETGMLVWKDFIVPIWSTTIATIWSFVPLLLASGIIGEFIKPIPLVVTATMVSSTSIAVLITIPLMIIFLKPSFPRRVRVLLIIIAILFIAALSYFLAPNPIFAIIAAIAIFGSYWVLSLTRDIQTDRYSNFMDQHPRFEKTLNKTIYAVSHGFINTEKLSAMYMRIIRKIITSRSYRRNSLIFLIVFALVSYLLVPFGFVKNEFFPKTDEDVVYVSLEMPPGTSATTTSLAAEHLLQQLRTQHEVDFVIAETGQGLAADFQRQSSPGNALFTLYLGKPATRTQTSIDIANRLRNDLDGYATGTVRVIERSGGPPAGADIQLALLGDDLAKLEAYAQRVQAYLRTVPGVGDVELSVKPGTSKLVFVPDDRKLAEYGVTRNTIGLMLRTNASGLTLDKIRFPDDPETEHEIIFEYGDTFSFADASQIMIPAKDGDVILSELGELRLTSNPTIVNHEDTKRTISVSATVKKGFTVTEINTKLEQFAKTKLQLPAGYQWKTGGVNEENQKSVNSILQAMILSFLLILVTMILEFQSYRQAAIVMLTIPLAVSGVFYIFGLTGTPLSFPALIGILALFGIVVTNAIVVVEKINSNIREGMEFVEAIVDAAGSRLEPVLLTSLSTIFGLLPITLSDPLWRGLGGAIIAGLFFSGMIKLIFIPVMYYAWMKDER